MQIIELLKFNVAKVLFNESKVKLNEFEVFRHLSNIKIIQEKSLINLWQKFSDRIEELLQLLGESNF
jgi:hypothetical protein